MSGRFQWTDEATDTVRWLAAQKQPAAAIADFVSAAHGVTVSKRSVIGRAYRCGIKLNPPGTNDPSRRKPRVVSGRVSGRAPTYRRQAKQNDAPAHGSVTFFERRPNQCPFPYGDPKAKTFRMCGHERDGKHVYCAAHMRIAYKPPVERSKSQERAAA
jgi:hypothetical protein